MIIIPQPVIFVVNLDIFNDLCKMNVFTKELNKSNKKSLSNTQELLDDIKATDCFYLPTNSEKLFLFSFLIFRLFKKF